MLQIYVHSVEILQVIIFKKNHLCINWKVVALQYCDGFCHQPHELAMGKHVSPSWFPLPPHCPPHPLGVAEHGHFGFPASNIKLPLAIYFTFGDVHVSMLFSQIVPPSPSPLCPKVCSLCLCLLFCPAHGVISTIF